LFGPSILVEVSPIADRWDELPPEERAIVRRACASRRLEFAAGRHQSRRLLARLGLGAATLPADADRCPIWPEGIVGSIAHGDGVCVAAIAASDEWQGLGIDVEPDEPLEQELWPILCTGRELAWLAARPANERGRLARLFFCAKESVYKCLFPRTRRRLEFHDVAVRLDILRGRFQATIADGTGGAPPELTGRWAAGGRWMFTGAAWRRPMSGVGEELVA
jgi:4'-phosphopantetheinyl transferase EntD